MDLDAMFGAFDPSNAVDATNSEQQQAAASSGRKRKREESTEQVESVIKKQQPSSSQNTKSDKKSNKRAKHDSKQSKQAIIDEEEKKMSDESEAESWEANDDMDGDSDSGEDELEGARMLLESNSKKDGDDNLLGEEVAEFSRVVQLGYNEKDYEFESVEFDNCVHETVYPKGFDRRPNFKRPKVKAKTYAFTLDKFQDRAVQCIEKDESVLVAAHTSAGKTAIAEYAIAKSLKNQQRVIYTSPIKALSNQKYRELKEEFEDVGLMTGDVTINETASCLVMTTEILRSMLYNGSEVTREMAWVIFDEVHYMRDKERGVVWEETIIMLSANVKYVFLSATIPNAREFAEWIVKIKRQPCSVVYTDFRPTPLQHYLFPSGAQGIYLVVDERGTFRENNFSKAIQVIEDDMSITKKQEEKKNKNKQQKQTAQQEMRKLITLIVSKGLDPCIIFSFSKRECEQFSMSLKNCDFNTEDERESVEKIYKNAIETLSAEDQQLPQITMMLPLLKRGIGIHHGGLLPIIKEVIELLFQDGLIKTLFTTETFSMGINMPAKTVVFTSIEKFDGDEYRNISGGEYIQMSGRAGRRGLDDKGIAILMANKKLEPEVAKTILKGKSDPLYSSFHLGYNMLLNMMRIEDIVPQDIIMQSFHQFQNERILPEIKAKLTERIEEYQQLRTIPQEKLIRQKKKLIVKREKIGRSIRKIVSQPENIVPFLVPGRLIRIQVQTNLDNPMEQQDWGWGILVNFTKQRLNPKNLQQVGRKNKELQRVIESNDVHYVLDVYLYVKDRLTGDNMCQPGDPQARDGRLGIVPVVLHASTVHSISTIQIRLPHNHKQVESTVEMMYFELIKRFKGDLPLLNPLDDMEIESKKLKKLLNEQEIATSRLNEDALANLTEAEQSKYDRKKELKEQINELADSIKKASDMIMKGDLVNMKRVMRRLDLADKNDVPTLKGKVACSISASDEIMITEMLFSGLFNDLDPLQTAAILSCLIYTDGKGNEEGVTKIAKEPRLHGPFQAMQKIADRVAQVMLESKIPLDREEYVAKFKPDMMELTMLWCGGATFKEVCDEARDIYEGTIIRAFRRLDELIAQLIESAKIIGNVDLRKKFEESQKNLKRGIVFTASLYL